MVQIMSRPNQPLNNGFGLEQVNNLRAELEYADSGLKRSDLFSPFFPRHRFIASKLVAYLMSLKTLDELKNAVIYGRDNINPSLFIYAFMITVSNRIDTQDALLITLPEVFPDHFFPSTIFRDVDEQAFAVPDGSRVWFDSNFRLDFLI